MPRSSLQRPPRYCRHKASGRAYVTIDGREVYLGQYNSPASREAYDRLIAEWGQRRGRSQPAADSEITIAEVMAAYAEYAEGYYRKGGAPTREYYLICEICRVIKPLYGRERAATFGPLALKAVRDAMIAKDWCRKHCNKNIDRVKRMFKWAAAEELIPASVPQALSMVAGLRRGRCEARETAPVLPVDDAVVEQTMIYLPEVVMNMVMLQRFTGMRPAELCMMRPCDIDRGDDADADVGNVWTYSPESHKTEHHGRERIIAIGHRAQGVLLKFLARDPEAYCFRPCDSEAKRRAAQHANRKTPLSSGNKPGSNRKCKPQRTAGRQYDTGAYRRAIHRACDKAFPHPKLAKLKPAELTDEQREELKAWQKKHRWSPNQLRHAMATNVRKKFGLEAAQVMLGHANANVTQVYAERDLQKAIEVAREVG